ncbi:MAG: hypothetical protein ABR540_05630 [Acidimicrobiales bacterium]
MASLEAPGDAHPTVDALDPPPGCSILSASARRSRLSRSIASVARRHDAAILTQDVDLTRVAHVMGIDLDEASVGA